VKGLANLLVLALLVSLPAVGQRSSRGAARSKMSNRYASGRSPATSSTPAMGKQSGSDVLSRNTKLGEKVSKLTGMDPKAACDGFKNVGQCVAAAHASQNLPNVLFDDLKARMTGSGTDSLGQAIHYVDPTLNAQAEAAKATKQADKDVNQSKS